MGTFWGLLNVVLGASYAQVGMDIVDKMWVQFRMGSLDFIMFWGEYILGNILDLDILCSTNGMGGEGINKNVTYTFYLLVFTVCRCIWVALWV